MLQFKNIVKENIAKALILKTIQGLDPHVFAPAIGFQNY